MRPERIPTRSRTDPLFSCVKTKNSEKRKHGKKTEKREKGWRRLPCERGKRCLRDVVWSDRQGRLRVCDQDGRRHTTVSLFFFSLFTLSFSVLLRTPFCGTWAEGKKQKAQGKKTQHTSARDIKRSQGVKGTTGTRKTAQRPVDVPMRASHVREEKVCRSSRVNERGARFPRTPTTALLPPTPLSAGRVSPLFFFPWSLRFSPRPSSTVGAGKGKEKKKGGSPLAARAPPFSTLFPFCKALKKRERRVKGKGKKKERQRRS